MQGYLDFLNQYGDRLLDGALITVELTVLAIAVTVAIAMVMALLKMSPFRILRWPAIAYIEVFRGTSLLVQLYWIFFVLPLLGVPLDKFTAGFLGVGMNMGAYGAELVRGGIQSVPRGQIEAAIALNLPRIARFRRIIFPQALLIMLPPWGNLLIELLKGTALVALISVADLMFEAKQINASTYMSAEVFGTALIIYYVLGRGVISPAMRGIENKLRNKLIRGE